MKLISRAATLGDADAISALTLATCRRFIFPDLPQQGRDALLALYSPDNIRARILAGDRFALICDGDDLVAAAAIRLEDHHIYLFFVAARYHRQGLGRRLMTALVPEQPTEAKLSLHSSMYARNFYVRLGFIATGPPFENNGVVSVPMQCPAGSDFRDRSGSLVADH